MPEYLSPGVYVEEVPPRLRAIEGVSTSTVGFAGVAERGPVPGENLVAALFDPVASDGTTISLPRDAAPRLITSYGEFVRIFGNPLPMPDPNGHGFLAPAVKAFFDNGGKRCYVSRVIRRETDGTPTTTRAQTQLHQGPIIRLTRPVASGDTILFVDSLRGIRVADDMFDVVKRSDGSVVIAAIDVSGYNVPASSIEVTPADTIGQDLDPADVFISPHPYDRDAVPTGPIFHARTPGSWGDALRIEIRPADRGPVDLATGATGNQIQVTSTNSFYRGAIIEINDGSEPVYNEVANILPDNVLQLASDLASAIDPPAYVRGLEIDIVIRDDSAPQPVTEVFRGLTWNPNPRPETRRRYYAAVINKRSRLVYVQPPGLIPASADPDAPIGTVEAATLATQPTTANGFETTAVTTAGADDYGSITDDNYRGRNTDPESRTGLEALRGVDDISIIACPGRTDAVVHNALITQCENLRYRFAVLDADPSDRTVTDVLAHRNLYDTSYAAYYFPWVEATEHGEQLFLPPSGFVTGIYARSDSERGVHKAPANEVVRRITGLRCYITSGEQDILNPRGVNAIRQFEDRGIRVWGARTLSSDPAMRYISTRRFLIFLEKSIDRGTQWVVFEPNNPDTWSRVVDSVGSFLHTQWRAGALLGRTPEQAYFVRCDESTMTADDIENGRLICEIGVAIVKPAEFVIFRIEQIAAFGETP